MEFFDRFSSVEELKKEYRRLAMLHHPDRGGDLETMKRINSEYEVMFNRLNNGDGISGPEASTEAPRDYIRIINILMGLSGLYVELCGSWLWISGDTRRNREALKAAGCCWAPKKSMWYWRPPEAASRRGRKSASMDEIREKYGSQAVRGPAEHRLSAG